MKALRIAGWTLLALVVLAAGGLGVFVATFDTRAAVARLAVQVRRATGRDLAVTGPVHLAFAWPPELVADGVTLSNPPGLSRTAMLVVDQVRARVALAPLLSGRAELDVTLVRPDLLVEDGNWRFHPELPPAATGPVTPSRPLRVRTELRRVRVEAGRIGVRDAMGLRIATVPEAVATLAADGALTATGRVTGEGGSAALSASVGPGGWPLQARADGAWDAGVLHVASLQVDAPAPDAPAHLKAAVAVRGLPLALDVAVDAPGRLAAGGPLPFTLAAAAAGASLTAQGSLADPASLGGLDAAVSARIPDLPALAPLAGTALPALGTVSFDARLLDRAGLSHGLALRSMRVQADPGNLSGDVAAVWAGRPGLRGTLTSTRLDLDALLAALPRAPTTPAAPAPPPVPTLQPAPPPASSAPASLIPDRPLPLRAFRAIDADLTVGLANLVVRGLPVSGLDGHLAASDGRVRLDPLVVTLPGGRVTGTASADTAADPPAWSLAARGAGLQLDRITDAVHGTAELDVALTATGATTRAVAASLDGRASLQLVQGDVDNRLLAPLVDAALRAAHVSLDPGGRSALRCLLLPVTVSQGTVATPGLLLDTQRLRVEGAGTADLVAETLALALRPTLRIGGAGIGAPVRVSGPFLHPVVALDAIGGRVGLSIGAASPDPDSCGPPLPADTRSDKPADLLRRLLR